jgi:hypothetical protein
MIDDDGITLSDEARLCYICTVCGKQQYVVNRGIAGAHCMWCGGRLKHEWFI